MQLFSFIVSVTFFAAFSIFTYVNLRLLVERYQRLRKYYFAEFKSKKLFFRQTKYLTITQKDSKGLDILCAFIMALVGLSLRIGFFGILFGAVTGFLLPKTVIAYLRKKHLKKLDDQLYSSLILLNNSMRAGETLSQAIDSTKDILGDPISQEFCIIDRQIKMGIPLEEALENFSGRIPLEDVDLAVRAMNISLKTGANLTIALGKIAETIRARNALNNKINALTIQGKAQGILVGLLPVFIGGFLYWNNPDYIRILFITFGGHCVVAGMIVLEVLAFFTIKKITTINI